ncbi:Uncharacterised protein [Klebsiella pneumoniae]|nr:Uncharacterised protein [Klebsiella pneumoniae]
MRQGMQVGTPLIIEARYLFTVGIQHLHIKTPRPAGDRLANIPHTQQADTLPADLSRQRHTTAQPASLADKAIALTELTGTGQQQPHRQVSDIIRQHPGGDGDGNLPRAGIRQIHRIGTDAEDGNQPSLRQQLKDAVCYADVAASDHDGNVLSLFTQKGDRIVLLVETQQREMLRQLQLQGFNYGGH